MVASWTCAALVAGPAYVAVGTFPYTDTARTVGSVLRLVGAGTLSLLIRKTSEIESMVEKISNAGTAKTATTFICTCTFLVAVAVLRVIVEKILQCVLMVLHSMVGVIRSIWALFFWTRPRPVKKDQNKHVNHIIAVPALATSSARVLDHIAPVEQMVKIPQNAKDDPKSEGRQAEGGKENQDKGDQIWKKGHGIRFADPFMSRK